MILERRIKKRNLNQLDILIQDTSNEFLQVFDVVDTLPQGRSSFTVNGSEFLKTNTEVLVEILDNANNPIFVNAIFDPEYVTMQGTSRSISVEVYPTTPAGRAVLTIVGELDHEKFIGNQPLTPELLAQLNIETDPIFTGDVSIAKAVAENFFIPEEYKGVYNVKFNKVIQINPKARNTQPIRFYRKPQIQVRELIRTEVKPSASIFLDNVNVTTGSISGKRVNPEKTLRLVNPAEITPVRAIISSDAKPAPQGGYTDLVGPNTLEGTIYNRAYPLELTSEDSYGSIIRRSWEFGDTHVTESYKLPDATNPKGVERQTHTFTKPGTYKVKLTVASPTGQYDLDTETVTLSAPSAPVAEFTVVHPTASVGAVTKTSGSMDDDKSRTFKFKDASTNVDNIVDPLVFGSKFSNLNDTEYSWSFGDGNTAIGIGNAARNPIHGYIQSGSYTVALTVKNNYGTQTNTETKTNHILIKESLPIVDFSVNSGSITQANALGANAAAILGATATFTNSTVYYGSSISYAWTFNSSGSTSTATNPACIYTGSYDAGKTFDVTLVATDNYGRSVTKTKKNLIGIAPSIPQPNFTANLREFTLTGSFEAKRINFTDTSVTSSACTYQYDFNGGTVGANLNTNAGSSTFEAANFNGSKFEAGAKGATISITTENPRAGSKALKFHNNTASQIKDPYTYGYDYSNSGEASLAAWVTQYSLATIDRNHMYTMEFFARADEPTTILMGLFGANVNGHIFGSGPAQGTFAIKDFKVGTSWERFNFTFRFTDVGCRHLTMRVGADVLNPDKAVYFDNLEVYKSTSTSKNPAVDYRVKTDGARGLVKQSVTNNVGTERSIQIPNFINAQFGSPSASFVIDDSTVLTQVPITFNASGSNGFTNISEYHWEWGDGSSDTVSNPVITHKYASAATYVPKLHVLTAEGQSTTVNRGNVVVSAPPAPTVSLEFMDGSTTRGEAPHEVLVKATTANQVTSSNITFGNGDSTNSTRGFTVYDVPGEYTITSTVAGPGGSVSDTLSITVTSPPDPPEPETAEDPEPEITADVVIAQEAGTELGSGGGIDPAPPAPYTGGGGGGDPYQGCVLAGTIIKTARGDVPVEQVTTDDLVYSFDFDKDEFAYYKIDNAWSKTQPARVFVETESGKSVECSDTHLFYHPDYKNQEICVKDLNVGDIVYTIDEDENVIQDPIRNITTYDEEVTVYNFNVPDIHSYITNDIISHNREKYESGAPNPFNTPVLRNLASPETDVFEIETDQTGTFFKKEMLGAELTIFPSIAGTDMETLNSSVPADRQFVIKQQPLVTKVRKIGARGRVIVPDIRGLMVTNRLNANKGVVFSEYQDFGPSGYSMSYQKPVTASFRVINKQSYSKINLTQLRPYSGDVSKVKVYYKTPGDVGGYKLLADSTVEAPEVLADPTIQFGRLKIGYIPIQQHIDYYWFSRQGVNAGFFEGTDSSTPTAGLTYVNDPYIDSMRISGSNYPYNSVVSTFHKYPMRLISGTEYAVRFQLAGIKKDKQHTPENAATTGDTSQQVGKIKFYISGSSLKADDGFGHLLGVMELDTFGAVSESFDYVEHNFIAQNNGDGRLQLVVESGEWYLGDLSVKPMRESGFSPDFSSLVVPTPTLNQRPTNVEYYAEFYDLNGNASDLMAIGQSAKTFQGSSTIVEGVDNTVSGSIFLGGETEGAGIEIHGGSSFIRNVGYVGYHSASLDTSIDDPTRGKAGFMFFSGSLLTDRTDEYSQGDVGFEIHGGPGVKDGSAGAMRFRTSTGKLEVTGSIVATEGHFAKNFSVGTGSSAIEISSSTHIMKTKSWGHPTSSKGWAISGSGEAYFQEGYIGGWQIKSIDEGTATERAIISGSNITLDAGGAALYMSNKGPGSDDSSTATTYPVLADEFYLDFTPSSSEAVTSTDYHVSFGPKFKIDKDGSLFASGAVFTGTITASAGKIGGFNIGSASLHAGGTEGVPKFFISGSGGGGSGFAKGNLFISSSGFQVTNDGALKATSGSIGGWTIAGDTISSNNLVINSTGTLETSTFQSGVKGWRISSANNGSAEFENVTIRGTMKTAVFEKESVNAVGGQLYIANSTTITGSNDVGASDTTIQVANASGFTAGEIITAKKVTPTSISTEYMRVVSVARKDASSDSNFSGSLTVLRQYGLVSASGSGASGSLGDTPGTQQAYGPGQVIVSTGKIDTGYIRLNANPNDSTTPYMDIVERTGSGVYDVDLKVRLGDLSGITDTINGQAVSGFGLYTDNAFLKGGIVATYGSIGGYSIGADGFASTNGTFQVTGSTGQVTASSLLLTGNSQQNFASGKFQVTGSTGQMTASLAYIGNATNFFQVKAGGVAINTSNFDLTTATVTMSSAVSGKIAMGSTPPTASGGNGILLSGSGDFSFQSANNKYIRNDVDGFAMNFPSFSISPAGYMTATDATFKGRIEASTGFIGSSAAAGWNIDGSTIGDTGGKIVLDSTAASPNITITSGSFFAEMVPDFTRANVILAGGGNTFSGTVTAAAMNTTNGTWTGTSNNVATNTTDLAAGEQSSALTLHAGFSDATTPSIHGTLGSITDATLTANKPYKTTARLVVGVGITTSNHALGSGVSGVVAVTGTLSLHLAADDSQVATQTFNTSINIEAEPSTAVTKKSTTLFATFNHTVGGSDATYYIKASGVQVTNNGITEEYTIGAKTFSVAASTTTDAIYFGLTTHQPSNKKTEIAPGGLQSVVLGNATLEHVDNTFVRISPQGSKVFEVQGAALITGSLVVKKLNDTEKVSLTDGVVTADASIVAGTFLRGPTGTENVPSVQLGSANDGFYHLASGDAGINVLVNNVQEFLFADAGGFHADANITAFSTTTDSDIRLKENIKPLENNLEKVLQLKPSSFKWKIQDKKNDVGLIAQDVEKVIPELVKENISIGKTKEFLDGDTHKTVDYSKLTTYLIGAVQEQQKQIDELKKKLEEL